jgi:predicted transposase YbfD/YdcC
MKACAGLAGDGDVRTVAIGPFRVAEQTNLLALNATIEAARAGSAGRVILRRRLRGKPADTPVVRRYLLSKYISPKWLLHVTRSHWGVDNQLHWELDVHFAEDGDRTRKDNAPDTFPHCEDLPSTFCGPIRTPPPSGAK